MIVSAIRGFALASAVGYGVSKVFSGIDNRFKARNAERKAPRFTADRPATDHDRQAAVEAYLHAVSHGEGAFEVPMAPDCVRVQHGIPTRFGREHLQWDLHLHLQYRIVGEIEILSWEFDPPGKPDVVHVGYRVRPKVGPVMEIGEDFTIPVADGLIHRIETRILHVGDDKPEPVAFPSTSA